MRIGRVEHGQCLRNSSKHHIDLHDFLKWLTIIYLQMDLRWFIPTFNVHERWIKGPNCILQWVSFGICGFMSTGKNYSTHF